MPNTAPIVCPQFASVVVTREVSTVGTGLTRIVNWVALLRHAPRDEAAQYDVVVVIGPGVNGFPPIGIVNAESAYQVIVPLELVAVIGAYVVPKHVVTEALDSIGGSGVGLMVNVKLSTTASQGPAGLSEAAYKITEPAPISSSEGK